MRRGTRKTAKPMLLFVAISMLPLLMAVSGCYLLP
jgi:hypothetical protein